MTYRIEEIDNGYYEIYDGNILVAKTKDFRLAQYIANYDRIIIALQSAVHAWDSLVDTTVYGNDEL